jgi:uncharacterized protein (DUF58 family)
VKPHLPRGLHRTIYFLAPCLAMVGFLRGLPALLVLAGAMALLPVAAALYVLVMGRGLTAGRRIATGACQDDEITAAVRVVNRGLLPAHLVEVGDEFEPSLTPAVRLAVPVPLRPGYQHTFEYRESCGRHRGVYAVGPLQLRVRDPMGFFARRTSIADIVPFDVYPKIVPLEGIGFPGGRPGIVTEAASAPRPGQSLLYLGAREYRPGDEPRSIHWPASARTGRLIVQEREFDLPPMVTLVLDLEERHFTGVGMRSTLEFQVSLAASLALEATRRRGAFQVVADGLLLPAGGGPMQMEAFLHRLVSLKARSTRTVADVLAEALATIPPRSVVVPLLAGLELDVLELGEAIRACTAIGCAVRAVALDDSTFLQRQELAPIPGRRRATAAELSGALAWAGARLCVVRAEDDPIERIGELFPEGAR